MKISDYIASLTASGVAEDVAKGLAKGQASALGLVDDVGLTMPLASGLVKGLVASGLSEEDATENARVAIAKGKAVDDLAAVVAEPVTTDDAVAQLAAASDALAKGYKGKQAQIDMELDGEEDDEDDEEEGEPDEHDHRPGDDRGLPDTMPATASGRANGGNGKRAKGAMKGEILAEHFANALEKVDAKLSAKFAALESRLDGIAKGVGAQGTALAASLRNIAEQTDAVRSLAKGLAEPRPPRSTAGAEPAASPYEPVKAASGVLNKAAVRSAALAKGMTSTNPEEIAQCNDLATKIIDGADDATVQAAAAKLGLA